VRYRKHVWWHRLTIRKNAEETEHVRILWNPNAEGEGLLFGEISTRSMPAYGEFHWSTNIGLFYCNLEDKQCHTEAEWNALMKPYMED